MISNSSPLIFLAKINQLELLKRLFQKIITTEEVKNEILVFGKQGYIVIENAIEEKWINIVNSKNPIDFKLNLGENSVINLAKERNDSLIIDDLKGIKIANSFNIHIFRTMDIIVMALEKKIINKKQATLFINQIVQEGYYLSPRHYSNVMELINSL